MGCNCNNKTPHTHKAYKSAKGNKDCPCGCGGACGCGDPSQPMIKQGQKCPCGCGGICGVSCNCGHCYEQQGSLGSLGRFDEYPRAKAGLFDPRKIGRPWPEPHPDPLVPYVRANEGLLPYEKYNEFQNRRNSMHGWKESLGGVAEQNTAESAVSAMMTALELPDFAFDYMSKNFDDPEADRFWYINPQGQKIDTKNIPAEKMFFAFIPKQNPVSKDYMLFIRCGGPENKINYYDFEGGKVVVDSDERAYLTMLFNNLNTADIGVAQKVQMIQQLAHSYPIVFDTQQSIFFSTDLTSDDVRNSPFKYNQSAQDFIKMSSHILDHIVNTAVSYINGNHALAPQMKRFMKVFLESCLLGVNTDDVASGIADAIVKQMQKDFDTASRRSKIVYEPEVRNVRDTEYKGDYGAFVTFDKVNKSKLGAGFTALTADLKNALISVIRARKNAFAQMYQQILNVSDLKETSAESQQALAQAQQQIEQLEKDKEAIRQAGIKSLANISKDYATKIEELQARTEEVESKDRELTLLKSKTQALTQQVSQTKSDSGSKAATALAGVFAVSTITLAYMHFVKK